MKMGEAVGISKEGIGKLSTNRLHKLTRRSKVRIKLEGGRGLQTNVVGVMIGINQCFLCSWLIFTVLKPCVHFAFLVVCCFQVIDVSSVL